MPPPKASLQILNYIFLVILILKERRIENFNNITLKKCTQYFSVIIILGLRNKSQLRERLTNYKIILSNKLCLYMNL